MEWDTELINRGEAPDLQFQGIERSSLDVYTREAIPESVNGGEAQKVVLVTVHLGSSIGNAERDQIEL